MTYRQYDIVIVNLDPTVGREIKKTRPCIIVSPNEMNRPLQTVIIVPVTSQDKSYPTRVPFELNGQTSWAVVDQIRTVDKIRVTKTVSHLNDSDTARLKRVIRETLVD